VNSLIAPTLVYNSKANEPGAFGQNWSSIYTQYLTVKGTPSQRICGTANRLNFRAAPSRPASFSCGSAAP